MMMTFVQELVNSLSIASVITLIAVGVTLIFGLTGIINFAHGEFLMLGAIGVWVLVGYGFGYIPALLIAVAIQIGLIGFLAREGFVPVHAASSEQWFHGVARPFHRYPARRDPHLELVLEKHP